MYNELPISGPVYKKLVPEAGMLHSNQKQVKS